MIGLDVVLVILGSICLGAFIGFLIVIRDIRNMLRKLPRE